MLEAELSIQVDTARVQLELSIESIISQLKSDTPTTEYSDYLDSEINNLGDWIVEAKNSTMTLANNLSKDAVEEIDKIIKEIFMLNTLL